MKVSFLVTYYNQKDFVKTSLESIIAIEKNCDWEILVGDDGSSDGTIEKVKEYITDYPNNIFLYVMPREKNQKYDLVKRASANRLNLLTHATGDIFCILDGDDYYCNKEFMKEAITIFNKDEEISVVCFGYKEVTDGIDGNEHMLMDGIRSGYINKKEYLRSYYIHAGACVMRRNWDNNRLNYVKRIGFFDDNDIVINNLNYGTMYSINKVIYAYRQTGTSLYTSMNLCEQAVLNSQGYDVDIKYIDGYDEILRIRNINALFEMFVLRKKYIELLGQDKWERYVKSCHDIENSYTYKMLLYSETKKMNAKAKKFILKLCFKHPIRILKRLGIYILAGR